MDQCAREPQVIAVPQAWALLACAMACETAGVLGLRFSAGFTAPLPTLLALTSFGVALYLVSVVMKVLPVSVAYPVWAGGGTAGVAAIGILALHEPLTGVNALGIALVLVGVALINAVSEKRAGC